MNMCVIYMLVSFEYQRLSQNRVLFESLDSPFIGGKKGENGSSCGETKDH